MGFGASAQYSQVDILHSSAVVNENGATANLSGFDGILMLFIGNGAGTATLTVLGSFDQGFASAQDALVLGVVKESDSQGGTNTTRAVLSGVISVAANTSYLFQLADALPYVRVPISSASGLGAGSTDTGLTVKLYKIPS